MESSAAQSHMPLKKSIGVSWRTTVMRAETASGQAQKLKKSIKTSGGQVGIFYCLCDSTGTLSKTTVLKIKQQSSSKVAS